MRKLLFLCTTVVLLTGCSKPLADFMFTSSEEVAPADVQFKNQSQKAEDYEWDFGDGNKSTEASPSHQYKTSGNYTVVLKAKKGKKESLATKQVFITAPIRCLVELETSLGNMTIELYDDTPQHRDNFVKLVENGFYNDLLFHRVINGFMIQGGDPNSKDVKDGVRLGTGGPGYQIPAEITPKRAHVKGALAAARTGDAMNPEKKSSGSQFYIVHGKPVSESSLKQQESTKGFKYSEETKKEYLANGGTPFLDQGYTVFGRVVSGMEIIDKIAATKTAPGDRPITDIKMKMKVIK